MLIKILVSIALVSIWVLPSSARDISDVEQNKCDGFSSCSSCLTKSYCVWCVNKGKCTKQSCGNDNHIHSKNVAALMSGPEFCPRVVESETQVIFQSGKTVKIVVKITQIHIYMSFTPWKCKISVNGKETVVSAWLLADQVYCDGITLINDTDNAYIDGNVEVLWEYRKPFDGSQQFKVCRCDLEPSCVACIKQQ